MNARTYLKLQVKVGSVFWGVKNEGWQICSTAAVLWAGIFKIWSDSVQP